LTAPDLQGQIKVSVKRGQLKQDFSTVAPEQLTELARRLWSLHNEGSHMLFELAQAGFAAITYVDEHGGVHTPPSGEYQMPDVPSLGRPDPPPVWPGDRSK
jgi:hypothetical protein